MKEKRNIYVIKDLDGRNIVIINDIIFKGKKRIDWKDVEDYLKRYIGDFYQIAESKDIVYIGKDLPREYTHSRYSMSLDKPYMKVKSNIVQAIPELIENAYNKSYRNNYKDKHIKDGKYGWYRYDVNFAIPIFDANGVLDKYKLYSAILIIRKSENGKMYLYDVSKIKKK